LRYRPVPSLSGAENWFFAGPQPRGAARATRRSWTMPCGRAAPAIRGADARSSRASGASCRGIMPGAWKCRSLQVTGIWPTSGTPQAMNAPPPLLTASWRLTCPDRGDDRAHSRGLPAHPRRRPQPRTRPAGGHDRAGPNTCTGRRRPAWATCPAADGTRRALRRSEASLPDGADTRSTSITSSSSVCPRGPGHQTRKLLTVGASARFCCRN
jgi:hypothetical protein